jgi:DNA-binding GntR family transcriptional regulator
VRPRNLVAEGLVEKIANRGCFVRQPDANAMHNLYELRMALELYTAEKLALAGAPAEWIAEQQARWEPLFALEKDGALTPKEFVDLDEEFHLGIASLSYNPFMIGTLRDLNDRLRFVRLLTGTSAQRVRSTAAEHLAIVAAIARRDAPAARQALQANLGHARPKTNIAIAQVMSRSSHAQGAESSLVVLARAGASTRIQRMSRSPSGAVHRLSLCKSGLLAPAYTAPLARLPRYLRCP